MREIKPTQKDVPSSDVKDLFFNSGLLDIWATSLERKYIDRFGNCHLTSAGMEWIFNELVTKFKIESEQALLAAGYAPAGTFQEGTEVVSRNGTVLWKLPDGDGDYYRWDGDLPKQVPAGSTPQSTGGIGKGAWVSVGDATLRGSLSNYTALIYKANDGLSAVDSMLSGYPTTAKVGDIVSTGGTSWERINSNGDIADFKSLTPLYVTDFGFTGVGDETNKLSLLLSAVRDGATIDLCGLTINQKNQGSNFNPYGTQISSYQNATTYFYVKKKNNLTIKNGNLASSLNMVTDSLYLTGFQGCQNVTFDNVTFDLSASGIPIYSSNGYETIAGLIAFCHDDDGTLGSGLTIKANCKFRIYHPNGASIGGKNGNPDHDYSGKLIGIQFYGKYDINSPQWIDGLTIESGVTFYESTARNIWCWMHRNINIGDLRFINCGTETGRAHSMIRMLHGGENVTVGTQQCINCWTGVGMILSNNNGLYHPKNVTVGDWHFTGGGGTFGFNLLDGQRVKIGSIYNDGGKFTRLFSCLFGLNANPSDIDVGVLDAGSGMDGAIFSIASSLNGAMTVAGIRGNGNKATSANGVDLAHTGNGNLTLSGLRVYGFQNGLMGSTDAKNTIIQDYDISDNINNGIAYSGDVMKGVLIQNGKTNRNGNRGVRANTGTRVLSTESIGNIGNQYEIVSGVILRDYFADDAQNTLPSSRGVTAPVSENGWIVKGGIVKSTYGKFDYGVHLPGVGTLVQNNFIGEVGTTAKWITSNSSTVSGNTPSAVP